jgi:hypothetical protein
MKTKTFDCVQMKRQAAARLYAMLKDLTREQELEFWRRHEREFERRRSNEGSSRVAQPPMRPAE